MNRKIILLPLSALMMLGLASCGPAASTDTPSTPVPVSSPDSSVLPDSPESSVEEKFDGGVSEIEPDVDCAIIGRVAQVGSKGWTIADGKAAAYVYGTLPSDFKIGDIVNVTGKVQGYYGLYEITGATVTKNETVSSIELDEPVEITADIVKEALKSLAGKASGDATWKPENSKRYKISGLTAEDVSGYAGWSLTGLEKKLVSYYYVPGNNETEANRSTKLYAGCNYDVSFYINGTNAAGNVNMCIFDVTSHYDAVDSVTVDPASVSVKVGDSEKVVATVLPATADQGVVWSSESEDVATVKNGTITGVAVGTTKVVAKSTADETKLAEVEVTVEAQTASYSKYGELSYNKDTTVVIDNKLEEETDPYISYKSADEKVEIEVRKNTSTSNVNVWKSDYSSCRWYVGHKVTFKTATAFARIVLTCDSGYDSMKADDSVIEGASWTAADGLITITLDTPATSFDLIPDKQIRPSLVELYTLDA